MWWRSRKSGASSKANLIINNYPSQTALGDLNEDGNINIQDIILIIGDILGTISLSETQLELADVNQDGTLTGNTLASGVTASSLTSVGTLTTLTVDNVIINGTTIGHTSDTDLLTFASYSGGKYIIYP